MIAQDQFQLHDLSVFPVVRLDQSQLPVGYVGRWIEEMEALLANGCPFALLFLNPTEEDGADRKIRTRWIKTHKARLAALCPAIVMIEPNSTLRLAKRAMAKGVSAAMGLNIHVVADRQQGEAIARSATAKAQARAHG